MVVLEVYLFVQYVEKKSVDGGDNMIPFPNKKYQIIYADPPWELKYVKETIKGFNVYDLPYPQMRDEEIIGLPVKSILDKNAILFIWAIDSRIPILDKLMDAWGFNYKTVGFVWNKITKYGQYINHDGTSVNANLGKYTKKSCEFCFIGTKGNCLAKHHTQNQYYPEPKRLHSQKPKQIRNMIVKMCGDLPRIELFARPPKDILFEDESYRGWDLWGNEC